MLISCKVEFENDYIKLKRVYGRKRNSANKTGNVL